MQNGYRVASQSQRFSSMFVFFFFCNFVFNLGGLLYCTWGGRCPVKIDKYGKLNSAAGRGQSLFQIFWLDHHLQMLSGQSQESRTPRVSVDYTDDEGIENVSELAKAVSQAEDSEIVNTKKLPKKATSRKK